MNEVVRVEVTDINAGIQRPLDLSDQFSQQSLP
jgi:hypothetical protein